MEIFILSMVGHQFASVKFLILDADRQYSMACSSWVYVNGVRLSLNDHLEFISHLVVIGMEIKTIESLW